MVTGLLGFILVGVAWTSAELVTGESLFGGERRTTYFGGDVSDQREEPAETTPAPGATATPAETEPEATAIPEAGETPAPEVTPAPTVEGQETPAPQASPAPVVPTP